DRDDRDAGARVPVLRAADASRVDEVSAAHGPMKRPVRVAEKMDVRPRVVRELFETGLGGVLLDSLAQIDGARVEEQDAPLRDEPFDREGQVLEELPLGVSERPDVP